MKNKKRILIIFVLLFCYSLIIQEKNSPFNEHNDNDNTNNLPYLSAINTLEYEWNRTWGGNFTDYGYGVVLDSLNNIYLAGYSYSFGAGSDDIVLLKYDSSGIYQWNRTWGGTDNDESFGVYQWNRTWGGNDYDEGSGIVIDSLDDIYIAGTTESFETGSFDLALVKYESSGVYQWNITWGGNNEDRGLGLVLDSSDNIYITGATTFGEGNREVILVKYNSFGVYQWNHTWGRNDIEEGTGIVIDSLDNIYIVGATKSFGAGSYDMLLLKYNKVEEEQSAIPIELIILISIITGGVVIGLASVLLIIKKRIK